MDYIDFMEARVGAALDELFEDVRSTWLTDLPDHPNVGDSAIALGEFAYLRKVGIGVTRATCAGTLPESVVRFSGVVTIHGGGNIGGRYPQYDLHREVVASRLPAQSAIIQAPQTIDFLTDGHRQRFLRRFGGRSGLRIAVRDEHSARELRSLDSLVVRSPDAFHAFGRVEAHAPTRRYVLIARGDTESLGSYAGPSAQDWPADKRGVAFATRVRKHSRKVPTLPLLANPSPAGWEDIARKRFERGVRILERGEAVITDRLHAMLIGLQMGRRVIAVDNATFKLSRYADAWFGPSNPPVQFVRSFSEGIRIAELRRA